MMMKFSFELLALCIVVYLYSYVIVFQNELPKNLKSHLSILESLGKSTHIVKYIPKHAINLIKVMCPLHCTCIPHTTQRPKQIEYQNSVIIVMKMLCYHIISKIVLLNDFQ